MRDRRRGMIRGSRGRASGRAPGRAVDRASGRPSRRFPRHPGSLVRRWYGAHWPHLAAMACAWTVAGYAAVRLLAGRTLDVALWFVGGAVLHDLVLLPLYSAADLTARKLLPPRPGRSRRPPPVHWVNYLRVPAVLSGLLLLVWFPLIARRPRAYEPAAALSSEVYLGRWLLISAALFAAAALAALVTAFRWRKTAFRRRGAAGGAPYSRRRTP